jgi:hypothetical protein
MQGKCPSYSPTQETLTVTDDITSNINIAFTRALAFFRDRIKNSRQFDLPGDIAKFAKEDPERARPAFQVLAPQLTEYQLQDSAVLLHIECVLYREAKYAGKHVEVWAHVDGTNVTFPVANVLGVVFEDQLPTRTRGYEGQEPSPV